MTETFYFGVRGARERDLGHFLWPPALVTTVHENPPFQAAHPNWLRSNFLDGLYAPHDVKEQERVATLNHIGGWTVLAFWDRSGDKRGASNGAFILSGRLSFEAAVTRAEAAFPTICARFPTPLVPHQSVPAGGPAPG